MKKRHLALALTMAMALTTFLPSGHAANTTGAIPDPAEDIISSVVANTTGNYRGFYGREPVSPASSIVDLTGIKMSAANDKIKLEASFVDDWPLPGAPRLYDHDGDTTTAVVPNPDALPEGTGTISIRWLWQTEQDQIGGNSMTRRQTQGRICSDKHDKRTANANPVTVKPVTVGEDQGVTTTVVEETTIGETTTVKAEQHFNSYETCNPSTQGPYHPADGWAFALSVEVAYDESDRIFYEWAFNRLEEANPVFTIFWYTPGQDHDQGPCSWITPATSEKALDLRAKCVTGFGYNAESYDAATLNGVRYEAVHNDLDGDGEFDDGEGEQVKIGTDLWASGDRKTLTLEVPYTFRDDFSDDNNGIQDETRAYNLVTSGDEIAWVTANTYGEVEAVVPPNPLPYGALIPDEVYETGLLEGLVNKEDTFQYGAGFLFTADWAPGNPFTAPGTDPGPELKPYVRELCIGGECEPDWGGYQISERPLSGPSYFWNPLAATRCRYAYGLLFGLGSVPGSLTTQVVDDRLDGEKVILSVQDKDGNETFGTEEDVPAAPGPRDERVETGLGGDGDCGHTRNPAATNWLDHDEGDFIAG